MKNILFNNKKNETVSYKYLDNIKTCGCRVGMRAVNGKLIIQLEWPKLGTNNLTMTLILLCMNNCVPGDVGLSRPRKRPPTRCEVQSIVNVIILPRL